MIRYLIKATYLEGPHAGRTYYLRKENYVTDLNEIQWENTTYASEGFARRECRRLTAQNKDDVEFDKSWIVRYPDIRNFRMFWEEAYEPIAVEV